ncbi:alpha-soluble NSF attachment protein-like isoform X2 [Salvia miltiorrhiza]|uniref:alpha-soluble NSF attachment protein-like isoform X2 n=1 Tax=Salvia miltiorrhiza TaxID=226208 RepID=UPI0025AC1492|nr:alpha-soluble NSF attachment protein-like isoform X2 [Salvia miltiorrhiza]
MAVRLEEENDIMLKEKMLASLQNENKIFLCQGPFNNEQELDSKHEAANAYADAAHCYKKCNIQESISCLEESVNIFLDIGRFNMSARYYKVLGRSRWR